MKVVVDRARCRALGNCEDHAPEYFEVGQDGSLVILHEGVPEEDRALIEKAVAACPNGALSMQE